MTNLTLETTPDRTLHATAITASIVYAGFAAFQAALALGAPFGDRVWGGALSEVLPMGWRVASGIAAGVLVWMALVVLARAGVIRTSPITPRYLTRATWTIAGFMALNTLGNFASANAFEQQVFGPMTAVMAALTAVVAYRSRLRGT
jgi:hypothetical protein